ncbi:MAG: oligosaccharide flippase family protein [Bacteroidales bacterium]|nr:oligosaccharide flippase family protein [Bacteroidales bacterium]
MSKIKRIIANKVFLYLITRYITFFLQFVTSMYIAVKLGPFYFGIWGFLLLLINYFQIINLGVPYSATILLVQHKQEEERVANYEKSSFILVLILDFFILLLAFYYYFFGISAFEKYEIGRLFYLVCIIAMISHFNYLFTSIYRVKKRLFEVAFFQTSIAALVFITMFFAEKKLLLSMLLAAYIVAHVLSLFLFIRGKQINVNGKLTLKDIKKVFNKGIMLFVYNFCFFMIVLSTRTIVSVYYTVDQFGLFTFSYTLTHAVILLLEAFSYLIFPRVIDKLHSKDVSEVKGTIHSLRSNYISLSHGLMYVAMICFPLFLYFIPSFRDSLLMINLMALTLLLYTNSFGYNSFLMARNKEKTVAFNAFMVLMVNIGIALLLVLLFNVSYEYVILATMFSYFIYAYLCVYFGKKELQQKTDFFAVMGECFPFRLLIPFLAAIAVVLIGNSFLLFIPFVIFVFLNLQTIKEIYVSFKRVLSNPDIVDVR